MATFPTSGSTGWYTTLEAYHDYGHADTGSNLNSSSGTATVSAIATPVELNTGAGQLALAFVTVTRNSGDGAVVLYPKGGTAPSQGTTRSNYASANTAYAPSDGGSFALVSYTDSEGKLYCSCPVGSTPAPNFTFTCNYYIK